MTTLITIGIAGGTGAGKTTLARTLFEQLGGEEHVSYLIHDSYYKDSSHLPFEERAAINFDHPESLETDLLIQQIRKLKQGEVAEVPQYDFATHSRTAETKLMQPRKIIIVEGILIFCYPELVSELDLKVYVDADSDIRLTRRIARDIKERGRTMEDVVQQYLATVRPMHDQFVEPSKLKADLIVHSTGHSIEAAIKMLKNHIRVEVGML